MQSITRQSCLCPLPRSPSWPIQEQTRVFPLQFSPGLRDWWQDKEPMMRDNLCSHTHNANARRSRTLGIRTCHELAQPVSFTVQAEALTTRAGKEDTRSPLTEGRTQGRSGAATARSGEVRPSSSYLRHSFFKAACY